MPVGVIGSQAATTATTGENHTSSTGMNLITSIKIDDGREQDGGSDVLCMTRPKLGYCPQSG